MINDDRLRYPIGRFERVSGALERAARVAAIADLEQAPGMFCELATGLSDPESGRVMLDEAVAMYAWHSRHHAV
jgi:hypothetical protein